MDSCAEKKAGTTGHNFVVVRDSMIGGESTPRRTRFALEPVSSMHS